jgi:hypothetical protein
MVTAAAPRNAPTIAARTRVRTRSLVRIERSGEVRGGELVDITAQMLVGTVWRHDKWSGVAVKAADVPQLTFVDVFAH